MLVDGSQGIGLLFYNRQVSQDILVLFAHIFHPGIQFHIIYGS